MLGFAARLAPEPGHALWHAWACAGGGVCCDCCVVESTCWIVQNSQRYTPEHSLPLLAGATVLGVIVAGVSLRSQALPV